MLNQTEPKPQTSEYKHVKDLIKLVRGNKQLRTFLKMVMKIEKKKLQSLYGRLH